MEEVKQYLCLICYAKLETSYKQTARVTLVDDKGDFYEIILTPSDELDVIYDAWGRGLQVLIVARAVQMTGTKSKLFVDVKAVLLAGLPKNAKAIETT